MIGPVPSMTESPIKASLDEKHLINRFTVLVELATFSLIDLRTMTLLIVSIRYFYSLG